MSKEVYEDAPFCDMPKGLHGIDYPAKYKHAELPKSYPTNEAAKIRPSADEILRGMK